jgi:hypothetical protein
MPHPIQPGISRGTGYRHSDGGLNTTRTTDDAAAVTMAMPLI